MDDLTTLAARAAANRDAAPQERTAANHARRHAGAGRRWSAARNFDEVNLGLPEQLALLEAERCLQCPKPNCIDGCPVGVNIPHFIELLSRGNLPGAADSPARRQRAALRHRPRLPAGNPMRASCIRGKKGLPVAIGYLERYVADWARDTHRQPSSASIRRHRARRSRSSAPARPASPPRANWPSAATRSRSSRPSTPPAACWSTASRSSACPRRSSSRKSTGWTPTA